MSNFAELEVKDQNTTTGFDITPPGELVLDWLGIEATSLKSIKSLWERSHYRAIINWLVKRKPQPGASAVKQVHKYLQVLGHLCEIKSWESIKLVLSIPIAINPKNKSVCLPLSEYLIFKQLYSDMEMITQNIINSFPLPFDEISYILMLKARVLPQVEDACNLFKEICLKSPENSEIYIEATARLGLRQVDSGIYQEGISNLQKSLMMIEKQVSRSNNLKFQELTTDILEKFAFYEMNSSNFKKAIQLYDKVIELRTSYNLIHKLISPLVHQGIILRRRSKYDRALNSLEIAKDKAIEIGNANDIVWIDHHLAYVLLNQGSNLDLAEKLCKNAFDGYRNLKDRQGKSDVYEQLGLINLAKGEVDEAEKNFEKSLNMRISISNYHGTASSVLDLALAAWYKKRYLKSLKLFLKGFYLYWKLGILSRVRFFRMLKSGYTWIFGKRNWTK